jgi:phage FluMu protein Com
MSYKITEVIEGVRFHEETPDAQFIGITQTTIERIIKLSPCAGDAIALYVFYAYTCKWQKNTCAYATATFVQKHFNWGRDRFQKAKNSLKSMGLIADESRRDEKNKIIGHYVRVRYAMSTTTEIHPVDSPARGKTATDTIYSKGNTINSQVHTIDSKKYGASEEGIEKVQSPKEKIPLSKAKQPARTRKSQATPHGPSNPQSSASPLPPMEIRCNECDKHYTSQDPFQQFCPECEVVNASLIGRWKGGETNRKKFMQQNRGKRELSSSSDGAIGEDGIGGTEAFERKVLNPGRTGMEDLPDIPF